MPRTALRCASAASARCATPPPCCRSRRENALLKFHAENPAATGIAKDALRQRCLPRADAGCDAAGRRGRAPRRGDGQGRVSHPARQARKLEEQAAEQLRETRPPQPGRRRPQASSSHRAA
ncbi:MAG: DNA/RNA-binding winged helix domain-containing protein [Eggerthellaceae bacterium]